MLYYIDGMEVTEHEAKQYFFSGHEKTVAWMNKKGSPWQGSTAGAIWNERRIQTVQDQIFNISGIQEHGGLEMSES